MRLATPALKAFLDGWNASTPAQIADLYTFTLVTGEVFRYSGSQTPIQAPAPNTTTPLLAYSLGPSFARTKMKVQIGPQIDELEIAIYAGQNDTLGMNSGGNLTWQKAFWSGIFDGAYCELDRAFIQVTPGTATSAPIQTVMGTVTWFYGRVGDIEIGRTRSIMRVKSLLDMLTVQMPRRLYQAACNHVFGATMCGYDRVKGLNALGSAGGPGQETIMATTGSTQNSIFTDFVPAIATSYDNGSIIGVTGLNSGFTRTISMLDSSAAPSEVHFLKPWIFPVVVGVDTFNLLPGCDKTLTTCTSTFNNELRFGGFPYIPPPESAVAILLSLGLSASSLLSILFC